MEMENSHNAKYRILKASKHGRSTFVNMADDDAMQVFRNQYSNQDLFISTWYSAVPDLSALRNYTLCFYIVTDDPEAAHVRAHEACSYISENFSVPQDCIEVIYNGSSSAADKPDKDSNHADDSGAGNSAGNYNATNDWDGNNTTDSDKAAIITAEIMILIPPVVFDGLPTPLVPALNYYLARQIADDGIENINIDVYQRDHFIRLPNSVNTVTGRFVIPLSMKELLYLDANCIAELSKQLRPEDSMILPHRVPEAADWFVEVHDEFEKKLLRQDELQKLMLQKGWEIPPCIRRLQQLCLYDNIRLEAYRVLSQFYSWIGASPDEIKYLINFVDRLNPIGNYHKMNAIITFGVENPWFVGCQHFLLEQFCPAGKCFMAELIEEYEKPYLF